MMQRCAVFSCQGLGDGLISLVLSNNLRLNGAETVTFHPFLDVLEPWFPDLPIYKFPAAQDLEIVLASFDRFFIIFEKSSWMQAILQYCLKYHREKTTVLNPIATPRCDYPYWEEGKFNGNRPFVENLYNYCKDVLKFAVATKSNGIAVPKGVSARKFEKRIVIHPMSSREGKNWTREKYLELANRLKSEGYSLATVLTQEERQGWDLRGIDAPIFIDLFEMASYVAESGYMIGNDSGIGHLASCLGLPTVTVCRSAQASKFWRPAWARGEVVTPSAWVPNIKGLRLRDKHWKKWISVEKVLKSFNAL
jgi:heptosyltransferase III